MPNPKRRWSHARKGLRQANKYLTPAAASVCPRCSATKRPHEICGNCGFYKGSQMLQSKPLS